MKCIRAWSRPRVVAIAGVSISILTLIGPWLIRQRTPPAIVVAASEHAPLLPSEPPAASRRGASPGESRAFFSQIAKRTLSPEPLPAPGVPSEPPVLQQRVATIEPDFRSQLQALAAGESGTETLRLPSLGADDFEIAVTRRECGADDQGAVVGEVVGKPGSHVILGYADEAVAGTILVPGEGLFQVRYAGNGEHRISELDPTRFPAEAPPLVVPELVLPAGPTAATAMAPSTDPTFSATGTAAVGDAMPEAQALVAPLGATNTVASAPVAQLDGNTTVDVMVVYTAAAATANGGSSGMTALINASVASANTAYVNSGVSTTLRCVYSGQVTYTESGQLATDLPRLANTSDGYMDTVHTLRNQYSADLVCLITHTGSDAAGIGYLWTASASASAFSPYGFSVVLDVYSDANLTFAHELGHNMGCGHASGDGGSGAYAYSYGYKFTASGTAYRTVMAYAPGIRIPYFSNPSRTYLGAATGTSTANNVQTLNNSRTVTAAIRTPSVPYTEWTVLASADLNADGKPDLIWRSSVSGRVLIWYMDGATQTSTAVLWPASSVGDSAWVPIAAGDFNADSKPDLIWRNTSSGRVIVWYMDGATRTGTANLWTPATAADALWVPIATGDFNADDKPDIIWRNASSGRVIVWYMNGVTRTGTGNLWTPATASDALWVPITTAEMSGDSQVDIVWRNSSTGRVILWTMSGVTRTATTTFWAAGTTADALWVPMAAGDFNADNKADLVWRNSSTGKVIQWLMDGTTRSSTATVWGP